MEPMRYVFHHPPTNPDMDERWNDIAAAIESGETEEVNRAIDAVGDLDPDERTQLFETGFQELAAIYDSSDDGYVRQATVRVVKKLVPGVLAEFMIEDDPTAADRIAEQVDVMCGFLLEAIQDDDGRVRQSSVRALKDVYRSYDALEDDETIESLIAELESMADTAPDDRRKHFVETKEDAEFFLQPPGERLLGGFRRLQERSQE